VISHIKDYMSKADKEFLTNSKAGADAFISKNTQLTNENFVCPLADNL